MFAMVVMTNKAHAAKKFEPYTGCYIGVYLDWAEIANQQTPETTKDKFARAINEFNLQTGKTHALVKQFIFFPHGAEWENTSVYGKFPSWDTDPAGWATMKEFCEAVAMNNGTPVLVLEPYAHFEDFYTKWSKGNPAYNATYDLAMRCARFKKPMFIIFSPEMNGSWYPWGSWIDKNKNNIFDIGEETGHTPQKYQLAFRNVSNLFHKIASNVAIVWCPNQGWIGAERVDRYTSFYPGDDYVDWVGLDFYEKGWNISDTNAKLWGGLFVHGLTHDAMDDPLTEENESVNFYKTFCEQKNIPLMICETSATLTYRSDFGELARVMSDDWKAAWWNPTEYGWLYNVYGTSFFNEHTLSYPIDKMLPKLKGIIWFNQAKKENMPVQWFDYRIGWNSLSEDEKYAPWSKYDNEILLYKNLIFPNYFITEVKKTR
jgi:hypothetical protein